MVMRIAHEQISVETFTVQLLYYVSHVALMTLYMGSLIQRVLMSRPNK